MELKTREQWEADVAAEAVTNGVSTSAAAEWLGLRDLCITIAMFFQAIINVFYTQTEKQVKENRAGTYPWYPGMVKAFQYGHDLVKVNGVLGYAEDDEDARIITQVGFKKVNGQLNIKVAKDDVSGDPVQLELAERTAFATYLDAQVPPGVDFAATSLPADVIKYTLALKLDTKFDKTNVLAAVDTALTDFRKNFPFNSIFYKSHLVATIKGVPGVLSVVVTIEMQLNNNSETVTDLAEEQELPAGYFVWHDDSAITSTSVSTI